MTADVHPVAALFPMLGDDELAELAADIKTRGLLHAIILDTNNRVLDGRNRLAACQLADVEPYYEIYDGDDPGGFALASNINRRHLTKGQQAMVTVRAHTLNNDYSNQRELATQLGVSQGMVNLARVVLDHAPGLVTDVIAGTTPLKDAYDIAIENKRNAAEFKAKMDRLRTEAPDLAALVDNEKMSADDAIGALEGRASKAEHERREQAKKDREHAERVSASLRHIVRYAAEGLAGEGLRKEYADIYRDDLGNTAPFPVNAATIRAAGQSLLALADLWEETRT